MEETLQQKKKTGAVASHLEEVACEFASIGSSLSGDKFIGLDLTVEDAISFLLMRCSPIISARQESGLLKRKNGPGSSCGHTMRLPGA